MPDSDNTPEVVLVPAEDSPQPLGPPPPARVEPVADQIISDEDKLLAARDLLRGKELDRYRLSLVPEDAHPDTLAILEIQVPRLQETVNALADSLGVEATDAGVADQNIIVVPEPPEPSGAP